MDDKDDQGSSCLPTFSISALRHKLGQWRLMNRFKRQNRYHQLRGNVLEPILASFTTPGTARKHLLTLPREIRDQIIGELLFPREKEPIGFTQNQYGTAPTAVRTIWPYAMNRERPNFDVAILRVCRQLQTEGEQTLYGTSTFNLMYEDWAHCPQLSYEFLQKLPRRVRRLIQRVERRCYSEPSQNSITMFDWAAFMKFLANECPSLHTLRLWGPRDPQEVSLLLIS